MITSGLTMFLTAFCKQQDLTHATLEATYKVLLIYIVPDRVFTHVKTRKRNIIINFYIAVYVIVQ